MTTAEKNATIKRFNRHVTISHQSNRRTYSVYVECSWWKDRVSGYEKDRRRLPVSVSVSSEESLSSLFVGWFIGTGQSCQEGCESARVIVITRKT